MNQRPSVSFACSGCGELFPSADDLRAHDPQLCSYLAAGKDLVARAAGVEFACTACGAPFGTPGELREHSASCSARASCSASPADERGVTNVAVPPAPAWSPAAARPPAAEPLPSGPSRRDARSRRGPARRIAALAAAAILLVIAAGPVLAWFQASATVHARISTGTWADDLSFAPGCSRARHPAPRGCPEWITIARLDEAGVIRLDFGDVVRGESLTWCDVLRATSSSSASVQVAFSVDGAIGPLVQGVFFTGGSTVDTVDPGSTRRMAVSIAVPRKAAAGVVNGVLVVTVLGSSERHEFPTTVRIVKNRGRNGHKERAGGKKPGTKPSRPPHPSPESRPTTNPSEEPTSSPEPSDTPVPIALAVLAPGEATALTGPEDSPPRAVAGQVGDALTLEFGSVPAGVLTTFDDVLRLTSAAPEPVEVKLSLAGPLVDYPVTAGFPTDSQTLRDRVWLDPGASARVTFSFDLTGEVPPGAWEGTLVVEVSAGEGGLRWDVPVAFLATPGDAAPDDPPSFSPAATPGATVSGATPSPAN